jgi:putative cell wall-binding protein
MSRTRIAASAVALIMTMMWPTTGIAAESQPAQIADAAVLAGVPGTWTSAGRPTVSRSFHAGAALGDGTAIVAGGTDGNSYYSSAERWSPTTNAWTAAVAMPVAVSGQVAVSLGDGTGLFVGGADDTTYYMKGAIFHPDTSLWSETGDMTSAHLYAATAIMGSGDVLVVGGNVPDSALPTTATDLYDVSEGTWSAGAALPGVGRKLLTATTLANGTVLVAGGDDGSLGEGSTLNAVAIYDPAGNTWTAAESMHTARSDHAAVRLADGRVMVAGGTNVSFVPLSSVELFDPVSGHWTVADPLPVAVYGLTLSLLPDGRVMAVGGRSSAAASTTWVQIYDPANGAWAFGGDVGGARRYQVSVTLPDHRVIVQGGVGTVGEPLYSAEIYTPGPGIRYSGTSRYETAARVSRNTFAPADVEAVYIAYAMNFPDALAGAAAAGHVPGPVLLVATTGAINAATAAELTRLSPPKIIVLGSDKVVSESVFNALKPYADGENVVRYSGTSRYETAAAVSANTFPENCGCVAYIAYGGNFPDALAGAAAAGTIEGPVLLVNTTGAVNPATDAELKRLKPTKIKVLGSDKVVSAAVYTALSSYVLPGQISRLSGTGRFQTAAAVSAATFPSNCGCVAYIAYAYNFPDALAGAAAAGTIHGPVLLSATSSGVDASTAAELTRLKPTRIIVLGSEAVISGSTFNALQAYAPVP